MIIGRTVSLAALSIMCGCASVGPRTVQMDRIDYNTVIADSWKEQTLLNIVRLRYMDLPVFVDVSSIVAGYSLQTGVTVGANQVPAQPSTVAGGISMQGIYTDRPTITYMPMTGEKFLRGLVTPIDPRHIFFMIQSGYAADFLLAMTVESLNGVHNRSSLGGAIREADPDFRRVLQLIRNLQGAGAVGLRIEKDKTRDSTAVFFFQREDLSPELKANAEEVRRLLHLPDGVDRFNLVYSPMRGAADELTVNSRSMLQILLAISGAVAVPEADVASGTALPGFTEGAPGEQGTIRSSTERPQGAFTAVRYRDLWFWVDDKDLVTKRSLAAINFFFAMSDAGNDSQLPLITIPAQ
ncbi:MAG: hypothetical protein RL030_179 [Pseudomonadota bacterium]|jgi:hypothetical protein